MYSKCSLIQQHFLSPKIEDSAVNNTQIDDQAGRIIQRYLITRYKPFEIVINARNQQG